MGQHNGNRRGSGVRADWDQLRWTHVLSLQALWALLHYKGHSSSLVKGAVPAGCYSRKMDEDVFAILTLDEAESFSGVKPLDRSCFSHFFLSFTVRRSTCQWEWKACWKSAVRSPP